MKNLLSRTFKVSYILKIVLFQDNKQLECVLEFLQRETSPCETMEIVVDQVKRQAAVDEIVNSDYFAALAAKAKEIRQNR